MPGLNTLEEQLDPVRKLGTEHINRRCMKHRHRDFMHLLAVHVILDNNNPLTTFDFSRRPLSDLMQSGGVFAKALKAPPPSDPLANFGSTSTFPRSDQQMRSSPSPGPQVQTTIAAVNRRYRPCPVSCCAFTFAISGDDVDLDSWFLSKGIDQS